MTHIANIEDIKKVGIVHPNSSKSNPSYISIGDSTAIETRNQRKLSNGEAIGDYIPFYLGPRTPMLYVIQHGYNNVKKQYPENIVYCVISLEDIINDGVYCLFTDGHALNKITKTYEGSLLKDIDKFVKYDDVYADFWNSSPDLKRRKEAELLLRDDLLAYYIRYYLVYNEKARFKLLSLGIDERIIKVTPKFYF